MRTDLDARSHCRTHTDRPEVLSFGCRRLRFKQCLDDAIKILLQLFRGKRNLPDRHMNVSSLLGAKFHLPPLISVARADQMLPCRFRVGHEAARPEYFTELAPAIISGVIQPRQNQPAPVSSRQLFSADSQRRLIQLLGLISLAKPGPALSFQSHGQD